MRSDRTKIALGEKIFRNKKFADMFFLVLLGPETDEQMKLAKNKIRVNL